MTPEQALADNDELLRRMQARQPTPKQRQAGTDPPAYAQAPSPGKLGQDKETLAYRMRLFSLDRGTSGGG